MRCRLARDTDSMPGSVPAQASHNNTDESWAAAFHHIAMGESNRVLHPNLHNPPRHLIKISNRVASVIHDMFHDLIVYHTSPDLDGHLNCSRLEFHDMFHDMFVCSSVRT
jgi:hypothetical protein